MKVEKIYFDMDGVLADFDRGVRELCHMEPQPQNGEISREEDDRMWAAIRKVDHFYDRLAPMPGAAEMFGILYGAYGDRCEILTGVPKAERGIVTASDDKIAWTRRVLSDRVRVNTVRRKEKAGFCAGPGTILIDDRENTIREWRESGGTGILHTGAEETLRELKRLGVL